MGNRQSEVNEDDTNEKELETLQHVVQPQISYKDAVDLLSTYLKDLTNNANDGSSDVVNKIEETIANLLSQAINFPPFVTYDQEDNDLVEIIQSLAWIEPRDLEAQIDLENHSTLSAISDAIHSLAIMTTRDNVFEMLSCIVDCCKFTMEAVKEQGTGADELLPAIIYVVLKSNPPKLFSHLKFISTFLDINEQSLNNSHRISNAVPRLFGTIMDCCFTNIQIAVTTIKNMEVEEDTKEIKYGRNQLNYLEGQYTDALNSHFEEELTSSFDQLKEQLNKLICVRKEIRDKHKDDMLVIADKLDGNKRKVHITKAAGLFASIGGGIISIVGFGLMFTTFGASAILIPLGASVGGAGGLTASISGFVEYGIKKSTANDIKKMRQDYEVVVNEVFKSLKRIEETVKSVWQGTNGKSIIVLVDIVVKIARLAVVTDNVSDVGKTAFQLAGTAGKSLSIASVVFSAVLLPIDMVFFGINIKKLRDDEKCKQAEEIRTWLDQDLPDQHQISKLVDKLKCVLLDFIKKVRAHTHVKDENILVESEEMLKQTLEEIKAMIDSNIM